MSSFGKCPTPFWKSSRQVAERDPSAERSLIKREETSNTSQRINGRVMTHHSLAGNGLKSGGYAHDVTAHNFGQLNLSGSFSIVYPELSGWFLNALEHLTTKTQVHLRLTSLPQV